MKKHVQRAFGSLLIGGFASAWLLSSINTELSPIADILCFIGICAVIFLAFWRIEQLIDQHKAERVLSTASTPTVEKVVPASVESSTSGMGTSVAATGRGLAVWYFFGVIVFPISLYGYNVGWFDQYLKSSSDKQCQAVVQQLADFKRTRSDFSYVGKGDLYNRADPNVTTGEYAIYRVRTERDDWNLVCVADGKDLKYLRLWLNEADGTPQRASIQYLDPHGKPYRPDPDETVAPPKR